MGISFFPDMGDPRENQTGIALDSAKRSPWKGKTPPHTKGLKKEQARKQAESNAWLWYQNQDL